MLQSSGALVCGAVVDLTIVDFASNDHADR